MVAPYPSEPSSSRPSTFRGASARALRNPQSWTKTKHPRANTARKVSLRRVASPVFILGKQAYANASFASTHGSLREDSYANASARLEFALPTESKDCVQRIAAEMP